MELEAQRPTVTPSMIEWTIILGFTIGTAVFMYYTVQQNIDILHNQETIIKSLDRMEDSQQQILQATYAHSFKVDQIPPSAKDE